MYGCNVRPQRTRGALLLLCGLLTLLGALTAIIATAGAAATDFQPRVRTDPISTSPHRFGNNKFFKVNNEPPGDLEIVNLETITYEFWVYFKSVATEQMIIGKNAAFVSLDGDSHLRITFMDENGDSHFISQYVSSLTPK